jgi:(p)ppGpp synthase/HD superfamily hydrolase
MSEEDELVQAAVRFAERAHAGQRRRWTLEPYVEHPRAVASLVSTVPHTREMLAAALLHDVLEDTNVSEEELRAQMGVEVSLLVVELTDQVGKDAGNRRTRKRLEAGRLATTSAAAQTIKVADLIDNLRSIAANDARFARVYVEEKEFLLTVLTRADADLKARARVAADQARALLGLAATPRQASGAEGQRPR